MPLSTRVLSGEQRKLPSVYTFVLFIIYKTSFSCFIILCSNFNSIAFFFVFYFLFVFMLKPARFQSFVILFVSPVVFVVAVVEVFEVGVFEAAAVGTWETVFEISIANLIDIFEATGVTAVVL